MIRQDPTMMAYGALMAGLTMATAIATELKTPDPQAYVMHGINGMIKWLEQGGTSDEVQ
jgi:hypothetical protein